MRERVNRQLFNYCLQVLVYKKQPAKVCTIIFKNSSQAGKTVIEACRWSEDSKYVSASNNNERLIKLDPSFTIQAQLDHVTNNHEQLKSTLPPLSKCKNNRGNDTNIFLKKRLIRGSISVRDQGKWLLHVLGSMTKSTQQKLLQDPYIYKSATCRLQAYIMTIDSKDTTKNSLTLLLVCDYLQGQEPTKKDSGDSRLIMVLLRPKFCRMIPPCKCQLPCCIEIQHSYRVLCSLGNAHKTYCYYACACACIKSFINSIKILYICK